jgi:hypothetical protein
MFLKAITYDEKGVLAIPAEDGITIQISAKGTKAANE